MWSIAAIVNSFSSRLMASSESVENLSHCILSLMLCGTNLPVEPRSLTSKSSSFFNFSLSSLVARLLEGVQRRPVKRSRVSPSLVSTPRINQSSEVFFFDELLSSDIIEFISETIFSHHFRCRHFSRNRP